MLSNNLVVCFLGRSLVALETIAEKISLSLVMVEDVPVADKIIAFCKKNNIKYCKIHSADEISDVVAAEFDHIDLTIVSGCGIILHNNFIKHNKYIVNIHPGLLPECRGRQPLPSAIKNHHQLMGVTAHIIADEKIDCGPIIAKISMPLNYEADYKHNAEILQQAEVAVLAIVLHEYLTAGKFNVYKPEGEWTYYKRVSAEDMELICHIDKLKLLADK